MPGIVGLITKMPREWAEAQLLRAVESLRHESFYSSGTWIDESLGIYVGWVARKNSFSDGMPVCNERGDATLVFSGEEYPEPGTAARLKQKGHTLEPGGPSYLVHLYEEHPDFPAGLNGRFHGILADQKSKTATLFNDRFGIHRLYYHEAKEAFYFAAEAKAILTVRPELRTADPRALGELVSLDCVVENRTIFQGLHVLPGASAWSFQDGALQAKRTYFQPREWEEQTPLQPEAYYQQLREVFSRNLPRYLNGRERVGVSLTGGVDSRLIMAWHKPTPGSLPCYTFGGMFRDCQDVIVARDVARICGQPHEVIRTGKDFLAQFPQYAERTIYLTDGCAGVFRSPVLYVNEKARGIAPVRMTGNYGGEVLRRLRPFKPERVLPDLFRPEFLPYVHQAQQTHAELLRFHPLSFTVFRQVPWHHYGLLALEDSQLSLRSPFLDNDLVQTAFRAPHVISGNKDLCVRLIIDGNPDLLRVRTDRGHAGHSTRIATKVSRSFLDFTFKAEYAYDYGMPQWVARIDHAFAPLHLERLFLGRHKYYHFRIWYRDALAAYVREMLLDPRTLARPYIDSKALQNIVRDHTKGLGNYTLEIHKVLRLELIHRLFLDSK